MTLDTMRLRLLPCDPQHLLALIDAPDRFQTLVGYPLAEGLHDFYTSDAVSPQWLAALRTSVGPDPWRHGFFVLHRDSQCVIGSAGFKGPPDQAGMVEIAYGIAPAYQGQGYATEAATALLDYAFGTGSVRLARAHTLPEANASTQVLRKCGFAFIGTVIDPEDGTVWRWERSR
ncbi:MAG TPA: GNAT family protein [Gemmatimonadales bacterium]|nr:GNAT family protein [Gemmatimonadales bacterium]